MARDGLALGYHLGIGRAARVDITLSNGRNAPLANWYVT